MHRAVERSPAGHDGQDWVWFFWGFVLVVSALRCYVFLVHAFVQIMRTSDMESESAVWRHRYTGIAGPASKRMRVEAPAPVRAEAASLGNAESRSPSVLELPAQAAAAGQAGEVVHMVQDVAGAWQQVVGTEGALKAKYGLLPRPTAQTLQIVDAGAAGGASNATAEAGEGRFCADMTAWRYLTTPASKDRVVVEVELDVSQVGVEDRHAVPHQHCRALGLCPRGHREAIGALVRAWLACMTTLVLSALPHMLPFQTGLQAFGLYPNPQHWPPWPDVEGELSRSWRVCGWCAERLGVRAGGLNRHRLLQ